MRLSEINEGQIFAPCEAISFVLVTSTPQSLLEPHSKAQTSQRPTRPELILVSVARSMPRSIATPPWTGY